MTSNASEISSNVENFSMSSRPPERSVWREALPYVAGTFATSAVGFTIIAISTETTITIAGLAIAILGTYAFFGVFFTALNSGTAQSFRENCVKHVITYIANGFLHFINYALFVPIFNSAMLGGKLY